VGGPHLGQGAARGRAGQAHVRAAVAAAVQSSAGERVRRVAARDGGHHGHAAADRGDVRGDVAGADGAIPQLCGADRYAAGRAHGANSGADHRGSDADDEGGAGAAEGGGGAGAGRCGGDAGGGGRGGGGRADRGAPAARAGGGERVVKALGAEDKKVVRGVTLRADPARDGRFTVANHYVEMFSSPGWSAIERRGRLHRGGSGGPQRREIAAQTLIDFPDVPWELRLHLARQCWDEVRHAGMFRERLEATGGYIGEFPVMNQEWGIVGMLDSLAARLTIQNRAFEGGSLDVFRQVTEHWRAAGGGRAAGVVGAGVGAEMSP